jgi:hypothetical protein
MLANLNDARHATAQAISQAGETSEAAIHSAAGQVGDCFASASSTIENLDGATIAYDLRRMVRRHPGAFLMIATALAAAVGYAAGSKRTDSQGNVCRMG